MTSMLFPRLFGTAAAVAICAGTLAAAAPARANTLAEAIAYAYETNPGLQSQRAALRALDENYVQARSGYGLQIAANAAAQNNNYSVGGGSLGSGAENLNQDNESVAIVQPLWTGGRAWPRGSPKPRRRSRRDGRTLRRGSNSTCSRACGHRLCRRATRDEQLLTINQDTVAVLERELSDAARPSSRCASSPPPTRRSPRRDWRSRAPASSPSRPSSPSAGRSISPPSARTPSTSRRRPPIAGLPETIEKAFDAAEQTNPQLRARRSSASWALAPGWWKPRRASCRR